MPLKISNQTLQQLLQEENNSFYLQFQINLHNVDFLYSLTSHDSHCGFE
jgi:hypothetical protein